MKLYDSGLSIEAQSEAFASGEVPVAVYGLGKMGLPLAAVYAETTGTVVGADIDPEVVRTVNDGRSHIDGEPGLDDLVGDLVDRNALAATIDAEAAAADASVHVVIVPTLVDAAKSTDLSLVEAVLDAIASGLDPGDLVVVESTVPPRTAEDVVVPHLAAESSCSEGEFGVAFCPERTSSGRALRDITEAYPKVVGGVDEPSGDSAEAIYREMTENDVVRVSDATVAEAVKVFEGIYRDVNIALSNELARFATELDVPVVEAIEAANTQPFCDLHTPGAGVGGHCIPYYPYFMISEFDASSKLMTMARTVNDEMPSYVTNRTLDELWDLDVDPTDASVLVLGATYRPGVAEIRETPALPIVDTLADVVGSVTLADPVLDDVRPFEAAGATVDVLDGIENDSFDAVVLVTAQEAFETVDVPELAPVERDLLVVDGRQALRHLEGHPDVRYRGVGVNL